MYWHFDRSSGLVSINKYFLSPFYRVKYLYTVKTEVRVMRKKRKKEEQKQTSKDEK